MPRVDGIDVIRAVRSWSSVPILVLSGRTDSTEKVEALDAGADDYVTKPFAMDELLARIRARSRRPAGEEDAASVRIGDLEVDLAARTVRTADGRPSSIRLTPTEWRLLELLLRNPGKLMTRQMLLGEVWGPYHANDGGYLRLYMAQLRRKLEPVPSQPRHLVTEPGMGYRFDP
jgi:two-component system KDP operon response regulator KdpE